jgi:hypothetical protein
MVNDFLDNLGAHQYEKMRKRNASKENYYNSESEGKEFDQKFWKQYNNTKEKKNEI